MKCAGCGFNNSEENRFCIYCGERLDGEGGGGGDATATPEGGLSELDFSKMVATGGNQRTSDGLTQSQQDLLKDLEELALDSVSAPSSSSPQMDAEIDSLLSDFEGHVSGLGISGSRDQAGASSSGGLDLAGLEDLVEQPAGDPSIPSVSEMDLGIGGSAEESPGTPGLPEGEDVGGLAQDLEAALAELSGAGNAPAEPVEPPFSPPAEEEEPAAGAKPSADSQAASSGFPDAELDDLFGALGGDAPIEEAAASHVPKSGTQDPASEAGDLGEVALAAAREATRDTVPAEDASPAPSAKPPPAGPPPPSSSAGAELESLLDELGGGTLTAPAAKESTPSGVAGNGTAKMTDAQSELDDLLQELDGGVLAPATPAAGVSGEELDLISPDDDLDSLLAEISGEPVGGGAPPTPEPPPPSAEEVPQAAAATAPNVSAATAPATAEVDDDLTALLGEPSAGEAAERSPPASEPPQGDPSVGLPSAEGDDDLDDFLRQLEAPVVPPPAALDQGAAAGAAAAEALLSDFDEPEPAGGAPPGASSGTPEPTPAGGEPAPPDASDAEIQALVSRVGGAPAELDMMDEDRAADSGAEVSGAPGAERRTALAPGDDSGESCEMLLKQLAITKNEDRRYDLVRRLGALMDTRSVPQLIELLNDGSAEIRECAVDALGNIGDSRATPALLKALTVGDQNMRYLCVLALGRIGDELAAEPLIRLLEEPDENLRYYTVEALGSLGSSMAVKPLIQLSGLADRDLRYFVARSLGQIGNSEALGVLLKFLRDPDREVRLESIRALGRVGDPAASGALIEKLTDPDDELRIEVVRTLGCLRSGQAVTPLVSLLDGSPDDLVAEVVRALGAIGDGSVAGAVIDRMRETRSLAVRAAAVQALGDLGREEGVEPLVELLDAGEEELRISICRSLGALRSSASLSALEGLLGDADGEVRRMAVAGIGAIQDPVAVPWLEKLVRDPDEEVRLETAKALGMILGEEGIPLLIALLQDTDPRVASESMRALESIGPESVEPLVELLHREDPTVVGKAVQVLGRVGDMRALNPLLELIDTAPQELREQAAEALVAIDTRLMDGGAIRWEMREAYAWVRFSLARTLGRLRHPQALDLLLDLIENTYSESDEGRLQSSPDSLQQVIEEGLAGLCRSAAELLGDQDLPDTVKAVLERLARRPAPFVRRWMIYSLGCIRREASATALVELLKRDDLEDETENLGGALRRLRLKVAVEKLLASISSSAAAARRRMVVALGLQQDVRALAKLSDLLHDQEEDVRLAAVEALARIGSKSVFDALSAATRDVSDRVRRRAVEALAAMPDERSLNVLGTALSDRSADVRGAAAWALGSLQDLKTVPILVAGLKDEASHVRESIVTTLGKLRSRKAVTPLMHVLRDAAPQVRQAAVRALGRIGDPSSVVPLLEAMDDSDLWVKTQAVQTLRDMGEEAVPNLVAALGHASPAIQAASQAVLSRFPSETSVQALLDALGYRNRSMRANAAAVLGHLGELRAVVPLIGLLDDRDFEVRERAAEALGRIGDIAALGALRGALKDQNRDVRISAQAAIRALCEVNDLDLE